VGARLLSAALEEDVTLIVTRAKPRAYDNMARYLKQARADVRLLYLSSHVVSVRNVANPASLA
jgi:hypothetical protein